MANQSNDPKKEVPARQAHGMDPEERDFWDLDDPESAASPHSASDGPGQESTASGDDLPPVLDPPQSSASGAGGPADPDEGHQEPGPEGGNEEEVPADEQPSTDPDRSSLTGSKNPKPNTMRRDPRAPKRSEMISLIVLGVLLLTMGIWGITLFFREIPTEPNIVEIKYPVTGKYATVQNVETFWRRPDREKEQGIQQKARLIPSAIVTLAEPSSGALRFFFEDDEGRLIGDPTTHSVANGAFADVGTPEASIHSTGGFENTGDHAAYVTGQIETWYLVIKEGPDRNAQGRDFKDLLRVPISKDRK